MEIMVLLPKMKRTKNESETKLLRRGIGLVNCLS